jgi:hypothetical protein
MTFVLDLIMAWSPLSSLDVMIESYAPFILFF